MKAISPKELPTLPQGATGWARSTKRAGSMFHAHVLGSPSCGARLLLDRYASEEPNGLGSFQYWGVCPRCYRLSKLDEQPTGGKYAAV